MTAPTADILATGQMAIRKRNIETHRRMVVAHQNNITRLEQRIQEHRAQVAEYERCIRIETRQINVLEYIAQTGHVPHRCTRPAHCGGCRADSGLDCMYETLTVCTICGGTEGSLLPTCPQRRLTFEEDQVNYAHYCASTGPFSKAR